jgi:hypothetical protein
MKKQHVVQLGTFGRNVSLIINQLLAENRGWKMIGVHGIDVHRVGGADKHVLVVFEAEQDTADFRE